MTSTKEFHEKRMKTNLEKYGSTSPAGNEVIKAKMIETSIKRHGGV